MSGDFSKFPARVTRALDCRRVDWWVCERGPTGGPVRERQCALWPDFDGPLSRDCQLSRFRMFQNRADLPSPWCQ
jgi:hypothetical protein